MSTKKSDSLPMPVLPPLLGDIRQLIDAARQRSGQRIHTLVLDGQRAEYDEEIIATLSQQLTLEYGRGFTEKNLRRMVQFAEVFPDEQIVATLSQQLGWSHFVQLLTLKLPLQREYYAQMCRGTLDRPHSASTHRFHAVPVATDFADPAEQ